MNSFGSALAKELNNIIPPVKIVPTLSFHLAGCEQTANGRFLAAYQIMNGTADGTFQCSYSQSPMEYKMGVRKPLRGGDTTTYVRAFEFLERYLKFMRTAGVEPLTLPYPDNLKMRTEFLRFQIVMVSDLYVLSNQVPWIGGPVTTLSISSKGIESYETRSEIIRGD